MKRKIHKADEVNTKPSWARGLWGMAMLSQVLIMRYLRPTVVKLRWKISTIRLSQPCKNMDGLVVWNAFFASAAREAAKLLPLNRAFIFPCKLVDVTDV